MAIKSISYKGKEFEISYEIINPKKEKGILFLHGWGSNKEIMKSAFSREFENLRHIYIDLPGFGKSPNSLFLTTDDYAEIVNIFLDSINGIPQVIVGHSFGGKIATLLNPNYLVLIASSGILVPKPTFIKIQIATFKLLNRFGLSKFREIFVSNDVKGMNEGMYQTFKYVVNENFEPNFHKVTGKTLLFWGKDDTATPLWTAQKINSILKDAELYEFEGDHFFFLKHSKSIAETIKNIL